MNSDDRYTMGKYFSLSFVINIHKNRLDKKNIGYERIKILKGITEAIKSF